MKILALFLCIGILSSCVTTTRCPEIPTIRVTVTCPENSLVKEDEIVEGEELPPNMVLTVGEDTAEEELGVWSIVGGVLGGVLTFLIS